MHSETKIARYGNSLTVRLPVGITRELDLREGDSAVLRTIEDGVVIERSRRTRLAARLSTVRETEPEIGGGLQVGAESLD